MRLCFWLLGALLYAAVPFTLHVPRGFPAPIIPASNALSESKVQLGRYLFYDKRLSGNGQQSCSSCHEQSMAFTDGRATAIGSTGQSHARNSMSLVNVAYAPRLTWANPDLDSLERQALVPLLGNDPVELGFRSVPADPVYAKLFPLAFPESAGARTVENVARALAAFQRTILSARSPYDRFHYDGDESAISEAAKRGEAHFFTDEIGGCFRCHGGFNLGGGSEYFNTGLYNLPGRWSYPENNLGLYVFTTRPADVGKFRAPSLRNIALTGPYMHDGGIATLSEAVEHYASHGKPNPNRDPRIGNIYLTRQNRLDLIEFLKSLTDEELLHDTRLSDPWPVKNNLAAGE